MRILSIDFDAIMFPCIRLYNEYCAGKENDTQIWNMLEDRFGMSDFLNYDATLYTDIATLVAKNVGHGATFVPIQEHDELITYLKDNQLVEQDMEIVNLDYHHDIMYHRESVSQILDFDLYSCADWLGYLLLKNPNNIGTWIRCPGSNNYFADSTNQDFGERFIVKNLKDLPDLMNEQFDIVFLCLSPQWVPYRYHHLYNTIVKMTTLLMKPENNESQEPKVIYFNPTLIDQGTYNPDEDENTKLSMEENQYD